VRGLSILLLLVGCDGIWDLEHVDRADASELPADLAAYFPMDQVVDGKIADLVGPNDGVCLSAQCPLPTIGVVGNALVFDGVMQVVNVPSSAALDTKRSFTIATWVRTDGEGDVQGCPVNKVYLGSGTDNSWQFCTFAGVWHFYVSPVVVVGPPVLVGKWQHIAATWEQSSGEIRIYHNGFLVGQPVIADPPFDEGQVVIGADVDAGQTLVYFPGAIDDFRVYTRALAANDMLKLAAQQ
jgi:hypothetical protein